MGVTMPVPTASVDLEPTEPLGSLRPRLMTREEFHRAIEAEVFEDSDRLELIDGEIYVMAPQSREHFKTILRTSSILSEAFGEGFSVEYQGPAGLTESSEPDPDIMVLVGESED